MSMYTTLLGSALGQRDRSETTATIGDQFAQLLRCRIQLATSGILAPQQAQTLGAVITQLDYDISLICMVRSLGIDFTVEQFDNGERYLLEQALIDRGIPLHHPDEHR